MATIKYIDGTQEEVDDEYGEAVWHLKHGFAEPKDTKQATFIKKVDDVFGVRSSVATGPQRQLNYRRTDPGDRKKIQDAKVREIIADKSISGYEKMRRVNQAIKERQKSRLTNQEGKSNG